MKTLLVAACVVGLAGPIVAQDADIDNLLGGIEDEAASLRKLKAQILEGDPSIQAVLFRRLLSMSDSRPDLLEMAINVALDSRDPGLRTQALWATVARKSEMVFVVGPAEVYSSKQDFDQAIKRVGRVVSFAAYDRDAENKVVEIYHDTGGEVMKRDDTLSVHGEVISFSYSDGPRHGSGSLKLNAEGTRMLGVYDQRYGTSPPDSYLIYWDVR